MEYFCAAKPQKRDLKAVQGAKRLMLERLVKLYEFAASNFQNIDYAAPSNLRVKPKITNTIPANEKNTLAQGEPIT